ncbi:hypothetical protein N2152v2_010029 [Parachlorella kessleri]
MSNVVSKQPITEYLERQGSPDGKLQVFKHQVVIRLIGTPFVPFNSSIQEWGIQGITLMLLPTGPVELTAYREVPPDPAAPDAVPGQEYLPAVDVAFTWYWVRDLNSSSNGQTYAPAAQTEWDDWFALQTAVQGFFPGVPKPWMMCTNIGLGELTEGYILHQLIVFQCVLAITLDDSTPATAPELTTNQASAVADTVEAAVVVGGVGSLVELVGFAPNASAAQSDSNPVLNVTEGEGLVTLEVTLYACKDDATVPSPECELQILQLVLERALGGPDTPAALVNEGISQARVVSVSERPPPVYTNSTAPAAAPPAAAGGAPPASPAGSNASWSGAAKNASSEDGQSGSPGASFSAPPGSPAAAGPPPAPAPAQQQKDAQQQQQPQEWVPYHLDRIDQRSLPLDGRFSANATGSGVNVYILSSGVRADHAEFAYLDGQPGTRVKPAWGYLGYKPLEDCPDSNYWFGFGTYAASLCCGLRLGAAKNATIYSVRYIKTCITDPLIFNAGGLPPALDLVFELPAVVLIDTWWATERSTNSDAQDIYDAIYKRLDRLTDAGVTIVAAAGPEEMLGDPCDNVFGAHPAVISVAASDTHDQATAYGPRNSSCISLWAPSAGLGGGLVGASAEGPTNYTRVIERAFAAAAVTAGVAAQYLELYPQASPAEVKSALLAMATPQVLLGIGPASPNLLLFTNLSKPAPGAGSEGGGDGGGSSDDGGDSALGAGAIAGISVGSALGLYAAGAILIAWVRRKRRLGNHTPSKEGGKQLAGTGWEIPWREIEILRAPDGSEWLLGEGRYGRVYKALKGGVQVVAVKKLNKVTPHLKAAFIEEAGMLRYVSRDANVTQFYGACVTNGDMMLVEELMEGGDLREALSHDDMGFWQWQHRGREVMLDIVRGVAFLHAHHVVHRDIKSKNVLVVHGVPARTNHTVTAAPLVTDMQNVLLGRDGRAKVSDVGLAKLLGEEEQQQQVEKQQVAPQRSEQPVQQQGQQQGSRSQTTGNGFVGTFTWAAPEVLLGEGGSEKADVYSLGVVLWEIVTEEVPQRGRLRDPDVPQECPQAVADAIQACMQRDPAQRPTALQLYQLLIACPATGSGEGNAQPSTPSPRGYPGQLSSSSGGGQTSFGTRGSSATSISLRSGSRALSLPLSTVTSLSQAGELPMTVVPFEKLEFCTRPDGTLQSLGAGSFGTVYKAILDGVQTLAVKTIHLGSNLRVHDAFLKEASILWQLRHPNIVGLSGVSIDGDQGYLLLELMEGGSLQSKLNLEGKSIHQREFGWYNRGQQVALDIARGVHYLHSANVTHFDLKSGNVLLTAEHTAKVADVGLSRVMSCTHHSLSSDAGAPPGTFAYMAPELMLGTKCTQSVDIFSLGVLLREICAGVHPNRGRPVVLRVPEDCPQEVMDLCVACTASDPEARPSAREIVEQLSSLTGASPGLGRGLGRVSEGQEGSVTPSAAGSAAGEQEERQAIIAEAATPAGDAAPAGAAPLAAPAVAAPPAAAPPATVPAEYNKPTTEAAVPAGPALPAVQPDESVPAGLMKSPWEAMRFLPFSKQPLPDS